MAGQALRKALAIDPRHRAARLRLVELLEDAGRRADATEERLRSPALPESAAFGEATADGDSYRRVLRQLWEEEARRGEPREPLPCVPICG